MQAKTRVQLKTAWNEMVHWSWPDF